MYPAHIPVSYTGHNSDPFSFRTFLPTATLLLPTLSCTFLSNLLATLSAITVPFSLLLRCLLVNFVPLFNFFPTPAYPRPGSWPGARMEISEMALSSFSFAVRGMGSKSSGARMLRRDLSTFREGEAARLAARERIEFEAEVGDTTGEGRKAWLARK